MRRRDLLPLLLIAVLLAVLTVAAAATRNPGAAWIARAEGWPVVGPLARRFRVSYLPPPAREVVPDPGSDSVSGPSGGRRVVVEWLPAPEAGPGDSPVEPGSGLDRVWIGPGMVVRHAPRELAGVRSRVEDYANPVALERRGRWVRIHHGAHEGWVPVLEERDGEPLFGRDPVKPTPVPALAADEARLERAREILLETPTRKVIEGELGPYRLLTDDPDPGLSARLAAIAAHLEDAYFRRYGRRPLGEAAETVVLFRREASYRRYTEGESRLSGLPASAHTGHGLVALYRGRETPREVAETLIHELVHLLNRRALGPQLPPWLDEGMAEDLSWSRVGGDGRLALGTLDGTARREGRVITRSGGLAAPEVLLGALGNGEAYPLPELIGLDWEVFVRGEGRRLNYAHGGLWVRFLLDGSGGRFREPFRAFLRETAEGEEVDAERLSRTLGRGWPELQALFKIWVAALAQDMTGARTVEGS